VLRILLIATLAMSLVMIESAIAHSGNRGRIAIVNATRVEIVGFGLADPGLDDWTWSKGSMSIMPGDSIEKKFENDPGPCMYEVRIIFANGVVENYQNPINFCAYSVLTITADGMKYR
jgi:hypothetical protein